MSDTSSSAKTSAQVVLFHYSVSAEGSDVESSRGGEPIAALLSAGNIIPGLDQALQGRSAGDSFSVDIDCSRAYGAHDPELIKRVSRKRLKEAGQLRLGGLLSVDTGQGRRVATVRKLGMSVVDLDFNHPMAGKDLQFDIEVVEVRDASAAEKAHGHAHGPGGHHHH